MIFRRFTNWDFVSVAKPSRLLINAMDKPRHCALMDLPSEVLCMILKNLNVSDLDSCREVNKKFYHLAERNSNLFQKYSCEITIFNEAEKMIGYFISQKKKLKCPINDISSCKYQYLIRRMSVKKLIITENCISLPLQNPFLHQLLQQCEELEVRSPDWDKNVCTFRPLLPAVKVWF